MQKSTGLVLATPEVAEAMASFVRSIHVISNGHAVGSRPKRTKKRRKPRMPSDRFDTRMLGPLLVYTKILQSYLTLRQSQDVVRRLKTLWPGI